MTRWVYDESPVLTAPRMSRAVKSIILCTVAAYVVQVAGRYWLPRVAVPVGGRWAGLPVVDYWFGLSLQGIFHGRVWQLVTYPLLHGGVWHLLMNMLMLFFLGPEVERAMGRGRFWMLYLVSALLGGLGWLGISGRGYIPCIGASGAVYGILGAFAALFPARRVTLLLFFVLPVTLSALALALGLALVSVLFLTGSEGGGIAHAAHLAGGIGGYLYALRLVRRGGRRWIAEEETDIPYLRHRAPGFWTRWSGQVRGKLASILAGPSPEEVDRILEKVVARGLASLTRRERRILERASERRNRERWN